MADQQINQPTYNLPIFLRTLRIQCRSHPCHTYFSLFDKIEGLVSSHWRQLEDALHRVDARLESVSSVAAQCSGGKDGIGMVDSGSRESCFRKGVVDVKAFAQTTAEKARSEAMQQSREMVENKGSELKDCFKH